MKIAVTTTAPDIDAMIETRYGRASYFVIVDSETMAWEAKANPGSSAGGGAGIQAGQFISAQGATVAVSGGFGPNAYGALSAAGIKMYTAQGGSVRQIVEAFKAGALTEVRMPTGPERHGGRGSGRGRRGGAGW